MHVVYPGRQLYIMTVRGGKTKWIFRICMSELSFLLAGFLNQPRVAEGLDLELGNIVT